MKKLMNCLLAVSILASIAFVTVYGLTNTVKQAETFPIGGSSIVKIAETIPIRGDSVTGQS